MIYLHDYFSLIIQFQSFQFITFASVETQMLPLKERHLIAALSIGSNIVLKMILLFRRLHFPDRTTCFQHQCIACPVEPRTKRPYLNGIPPKTDKNCFNQFSFISTQPVFFLCLLSQKKKRFLHIYMYTKSSKDMQDY